MSRESGPVHVTGQVLATKVTGAYRHLTIAAPGIPERFRVGNFIAVSVDGGRLARRALWIHRVKQTGAYGPTIEVVVAASGAGTRWLADVPVGTKVAVTGPLGRPFALPKEPVGCLLVGEEHSASPLFALAQRLRERGCRVDLMIGAVDEAHLLTALEARRVARTVTIVTGDGSVGLKGELADHLDTALERADADVVYAVGPVATLATVAAAAERRGAWSQVGLETAMPCGTGLCQGCPVPVISETGGRRIGRGCVDGPIIRGDRVDWETLT